MCPGWAVYCIMASAKAILAPFWFIWIVSINTPVTSTEISVGCVVPSTVNEANSLPSPMKLITDAPVPEPSMRPIVPVMVLNWPLRLRRFPPLAEFNATEVVSALAYGLPIIFTVLAVKAPLLRFSNVGTVCNNGAPCGIVPHKHRCCAILPKRTSGF